MVQKMGLHFPLYLGPSGSNCFHPASDTAWYLSTSAGVTFSDVANAATPLDAVQMVPLAGWLQVGCCLLFIAGCLFYYLLRDKKQCRDLENLIFLDVEIALKLEKVYCR